MIKKILAAVLFLFAFPIFAQSGVEMADSFRAEGKIYVVIATILIVLAGIIFYLVRTEMRLKKLEKDRI